MMTFLFNDCGVCTNPNIHDYSKPGIEVLVKTATDGKLWGFGIDTWNKKELSGYGCGVHLRGCKFESEQEAIQAGLTKVFGNKPQVQLKLF